MDKIDELIDLFNRTLMEAESNNAEYLDYLERTRIEDKKYFDGVRQMLSEVSENIAVIKNNLDKSI